MFFFPNKNNTLTKKTFLSSKAYYSFYLFIFKRTQMSLMKRNIEMWSYCGVVNIVWHANVNERIQFSINTWLYTHLISKRVPISSTCIFLTFLPETWKYIRYKEGSTTMIKHYKSDFFYFFERIFNVQEKKSGLLMHSIYIYNICHTYI